MAIFNNSIIPAAAAAADDVVTKSLRCDGGNLYRTPSGGDTQTWTQSVWVKRTALGVSYQHITQAFDGYSSNQMWWTFMSDDKLDYYSGGSPAQFCAGTTTRVFRDTASFYHLVLAVDATLSNGPDRVKLWVNGVQETLVSISGYNYYPSQNATTLNWNGAWVNNISGSSTTHYLADFHFIDGTALTPTSFAEEDATTGQWKPKAYDTADGAYGNNGFHLDFEDDTAIGNDVSGEGNDFDGVTNLAASDVVEDTPTNSYATLNALDRDTAHSTMDEGNLYWATSSYSDYAAATSATIQLPSSGKWYFEFRVSSVGTGHRGGISITDDQTSCQSAFGISSSWNTGGNPDNQIHVHVDAYTGGFVAINARAGGSDNSTTHESLGAGDYIISVAIDSGAKKLWARRDGGSWYDSGDPANGTDPNATWTLDYSRILIEACNNTAFTGSSIVRMNFGADPTFQGTYSTTPATSEFAFSPPTDFKALSTGNLATPTIAKPAEHFDTAIYTGNATDGRTNAATLEFQPDLVWIKRRSSAKDHGLYDSVRGTSNELESNSTTVEDTSPDQGYVSAFNATGFTLTEGGTDFSKVNGDSSNTYVAWNWKGGTTATQSGTHTYELQLEVTDSGGDGWSDWGSYTTPRLQVWEGATSLGYASHLYDGDTTQYYTIKTNNKDAIKIVWDYDSSDGGTLDQQGATLKDGSTVIQTAWTTSDTVVDGEVWITQSTSTNESTVGTLSTGAPASYPESNYNAAAGFSIAKWTGDDTGSGNGQTVNHNLGVAPEMIIAKNRTSTASGNGDWMVYHKDVTSGSYMRLNTTDAETVQYTNTMQSITSVKVDFYSDSGAMNYLNYGGGMDAAEDYVCYFFASKAGYSLVGSYTGNASADGTFVYCGFRPAYIMVKKVVTSGYSWYIHDTARSPYNYSDLEVIADGSNAEWSVSGAGAGERVDILSNGFKNRSTNDAWNGSGAEYIFYAVAESPLKTANAR